MTWLQIKLALKVAAVLTAGWFAWSWNDRAWQRGYDARIAEETATVKEKTDAANRADGDAARCVLDPACRVQNDGFRRD